ncbi:MAG TPA: hypothetical protein PLP19_06680 [bacterium]|nr:hypothetical protein [bacterium]HPN43155.1 hypothetical protein [bacterium]
MKTTVYNASTPNIVDAEYDEDIKSIIVTWHTMIAINDLEPCIRAQSKVAKEKNAKSVIMNTSYAKNSIRKDDMDWIEAFYFPRLVHAGVEAIIIIPPISAITSKALGEYKVKAQKAGLHIYETPDMINALETAKLIRDNKMQDPA